jgi:lysyl-tRNA synthetase class 2
MGSIGVLAAATAASSSQPLPQSTRGALLAFTSGLLITFIFVRINTRLIRAHVSWWFHDITPGGRHIHHMVFGVVLMAAAGLLEFSERPTGAYLSVIAFAFGAGVALTLDEFALILNLQDVYWREEGRRSVDAVVVAAAAALLLLLGSNPVVGKVAPNTPGQYIAFVVVLNLGFALLCFLKGKLWTGFIGLWVPLVAIVGTIRLARPGSPWARWRYGSRPKKTERAQVRFEREDRRREALRTWFYDFVAGKPSLPPLSRTKRDKEPE